MSANPRVSTITSITADTNDTKTYSYDLIDRLVEYNSTASDQNFTYDANGNRLSIGEDNTTKSYTYTSKTNTLTNIDNTTYTYDATGNIIDDGTHTYTYDGRNRLVGVDSNVTYQYNYDNKRVSKSIAGTTTYYIYDAHKLIGEYDANGAVIKEYVYHNDTPIAIIDKDSTKRIYADHLNTPRRVANTTNDIIWSWESKPFGEDAPTGSYMLNLRFPGQYFDVETGHHYNINRDYNPVTGRYIQSDPIGFDGGVNGYLYVGGNPVVLVDLLGLDASGDRQKEIDSLLSDLISANATPVYVKGIVATATIRYVDYEPISADEYGITFAIAVRSVKTINIGKKVWTSWRLGGYYSHKHCLVYVMFHEIQHLADHHYKHRDSDFKKLYEKNAAQFLSEVGLKWM